MYRVKNPDGTCIYVRRDNQGAWVDLRKKAFEWAERSGGVVQAPSHRKYIWMKDGEEIYPRWENV